MPATRTRAQMSALRPEFLFLFLSCLIPVSFVSAVYNRIETLPGCPSKCGSLDIPYPFGVGENCSISKWTKIKCNTTFNPPKPFIGQIEVVHLSLTELRIKSDVATSCFDKSGSQIQVPDAAWFTLKGSPFTFSSTQNKLFAIGCDTFLTTLLEDDTPLTCRTSCDSENSVAEGSCTGIGCCQAPIPKKLNYFYATVGSFNNYTFVNSFDTCGSAFMAEEANYTFKTSDFTNPSSLPVLPIVINIAVDNKTCEAAKRNATAYACKENSYCHESVDGTGYLCSCNKGFEGNPYIKQSCQDVNECEDPNNNPCKGICTNTYGSYECSCPLDFYGDGTKNGSGCTKKNKKFPVLQISLGLGFGFLFLLLCGLWLFFTIKKRSIFKQKEKFFHQNGGLLLQQQLTSKEGGVESVKVFTSDELKLATNNYSEDRILGRGGSGTVYKGILPDLRIIAIKKSRFINESQLKEFINEVIILTQINHRNVVKLLGVCLEAEVPMLVYEFVSNGTLLYHLHKKDGTISSLTWQDRLRIASETATALAYLHSAASIPVFHRDVKSANILLDDNYTAKVADFGASRLNPTDETQISTLIQGTMGYLDPSYYESGQLTAKSDVYSFGVVVVELLTGEKPVSFERPQEQRDLATYFTMSFNENGVIQLLHPTIVSEGYTEEALEVAELANKCLYANSEERPTMKEVSMKLEGLRGFQKHQPVRKVDEKTESPSFEEDRDLYSIPSTGVYSTNGYSAEYSSDMETRQSMNAPR